MCGAFCNGDCGWSTAESRCALGHVTRGEEYFAGACSSGPEGTTTAEPDEEDTTVELPLDFDDERRTAATPQTGGQINLAEDVCNLIRCCRDCVGECGWSSTLGGICATGHFTLDSEMLQGDCTTSGPTLAPTIAIPEPTPTPTPTTSEPTTSEPTTSEPSPTPTTSEPTTSEPTTSEPSPTPTTSEPTTSEPTTSQPSPTPTTSEPTPTTSEPSPVEKMSQDT